MTYLIDHTKTIWGVAAIILGIYLAFVSISNWTAYLASNEKFTVDATCIHSEKSTYYDSSKPIGQNNAPYEVTWQFELYGETQTFTTKEEYAHPAPKKLTFYTDKDGNLQRLSDEGGVFKSLIKAIGLPIVCIAGGGVLIYDDNKKLKLLLRRKKKSRDDARAIVELNKRDRKRQSEQQKKDS